MASRAFANPFRAKRLGGYMPFIWYGARTREWFRLMRSGGYDVTLNRLPNIVGVSVFALFESALCRMAEAIYADKTNETEVIPPVFVLGHWRSGTTFLHNLLTRDPSFAYPTLFQCSFPSTFLLTERARFMVGIFMPSERPVDDVPMGLDQPFEDEFAIMKLGLGSPYADMAFPRHPPSPRFLDLGETTEAERKAWEDGLLGLMRRFQLSRPGKRLMLKSPPHTARIATLLKLFPDARFIHVARNPFEVYPSTINLWKVLNSRAGLHNPAGDDGWLAEYVLSTLPRIYTAYERDRSLVPPGRLAEISYEALVADPAATLEAVYEQIGLGPFEPVRQPLEAYLATLSEHKTAKWTLPEADRATIESNWARYFDLFGYPRTAA